MGSMSPKDDRRNVQSAQCFFWRIIPSDLTHPMQGTIPHKGLNSAFPTTTVDGSCTTRGW